MRRFLEDVLELSERSAGFKVLFATAREAFNIAMAAVEGRSGEPGLYRDYQLRQIMQESKNASAQQSYLPDPLGVGAAAAHLEQGK